MQREEVSHNTPDQVRHYISEALSLVETLDVPTDLRAAAFTKAVDLFASKQLLLTQPQPVSLSPAQIASLRAGAH